MKLKLAISIFAVATNAFLFNSNKALSQTPIKKGITKARPVKKMLTESDKGKNLIEKSDCLSCHRPNVRLIGPSYKEVAGKYPLNEATYSLLTQKIINGGKGNWGEVAMSPHPNLVPADVKKMVKYILSFK
jgi:cytochrome c